MSIRTCGNKVKTKDVAS